MEKKETVYVEESLEQKIEKVKQNRIQEGYLSSQIVSDTMRHLTISGIAVAWMFRTEGNNSLLNWAICIFILNLLLDLFYNHYRMNIFFEYAREKLKKANPPENPEKEEDIINVIPKYLEYLSKTLWYSRLFLMFLGYFFILMPQLCKLCQ